MKPPDEVRYLQFPLFLLRKLFTDKAATINSIIDYGIYRYSLLNRPTPERVARQLLYDYVNENLPGSLHKMTETIISNEGIVINFDYRGFEPGGSFCETEIPTLVNVFDKYPEFTDDASNHYQLHAIKQTSDPLGITIRSDPASIKAKALKIEQLTPEREPYPMVSKNLLFDFRDNDKTEAEIMRFAAFIGIRSILCTKPYAKTNKGLILARMFGYSRPITDPATLSPATAELYRKYSVRYHFDKLMNDLQTDWGIITYAQHTRGIWIGKIGKQGRDSSLRQMITVAEQQKRKAKQNIIKGDEKRIREQVLQHLK